MREETRAALAPVIPTEGRNRIMRRPEVEKFTGLSCTAIYRAMAAGDFPKPIKLASKAVGWRSLAIEAWLDSRKEVA